MSFSTEKDALLAILKTRQCSATKDVYDKLNSYGDIPPIYFKYAKAFDGDNAYLDQLALIFDDASLVANRIYYNKGAASLSNPRIVAKSNYISILIDAGGNYGDIEIVGSSNITEVIVSNNTQVGTLTVAGGSAVTKITVEPGSCIDSFILKSENGQDSSVGKIVGACVKNVAASEDSIFGGYECEYTMV